MRTHCAHWYNPLQVKFKHFWGCHHYVKDYITVHTLASHSYGKIGQSNSIQQTFIFFFLTTEEKWEPLNLSRSPFIQQEAFSAWKQMLHIIGNAHSKALLYLIDIHSYNLSHLSIHTHIHTAMVVELPFKVLACHRKQVRIQCLAQGRFSSFFTLSPNSHKTRSRSQSLFETS